MLRVLLILACLGGLFAGVFFWSSHSRASRADFVFINRGEIGTLDPNRMSWVQDIRVGYALWEGLYALDPKTLKAIPGTADQIDISADARTYTFHIRDSARWSNGEAVTAGDFAFAWRRMLEEPGDYTYLFAVIEGAKEYQEAFAAARRGGTPEPDFERVGIKVVGEKVLRVQLEHPVAYFPDICAFAPFWPLHERSMRPYWDPATRAYSKGFTRPPALVTNGPYRLASWTFRESLRLEANSHYWDAAGVKCKSIEVLIGTDPMWSYLKYQSGAADWLTDATGSIGAELYQQKRADLHVFPGFGTYMYKINCQAKLPDGIDNPFRDARVRRAFSMAIDRQGIVDSITRLGESIARTYVPPGVFSGYRTPEGVGFDAKEARRLLAEAGYPGGRGFPRVSIIFNSEAHHGDVGQYVRRQWLENLGVDVSLEPMEVKVFRQQLRSGLFAVARGSWSGDYNDISTFLDCYRSGSENNDTGWSNLQYDRLMDLAAVETDQARRQELFGQAEQLLMQEQPIVPLYHYVNAYLFREDVKGLYTNARNMVMFQPIQVKSGR